MVKGFMDENKVFHPLTQSRGVRKSRDQTAKAQGINVTRYKKIIPRVTIQKHGKGNNFNYTVNLSGRGMYVVGTKNEAEERAQDMRESVQSYLKNGAIFDKDGYVVSYERKSHDSHECGCGECGHSDGMQCGADNCSCCCVM
jgi:hypothetical protein